MTKPTKRGGAGPYRKGAALERVVKKAYEAAGWFVVRSPQSGSAIDLLAVPPGGPPDPELAWAAGFFDGEGSTMVHTLGQTRDRPKVYRYLKLTVSQKDRRPLERFQRAVGVGTVSGPYVSAPICQWQAQSRQGLDALERLFPFLSAPKQEQANRVLSELGLSMTAMSRYAPGLLEWCQVKSRRYIRPNERLAVVDLAKAYGGIPVLAWGSGPICCENLATREEMDVFIHEHSSATDEEPAT